MCVIFHFTPGSSLNKQQFINAVHNNWHGYGLVMVDGNKQIQMVKGFNEEGTDPEVLWKLITDNNDIDRYLHIRHSTKGATDETNVQPFPVYSSNDRIVYFMHNGTLGYAFGSNNTGKSDTLEFCEKILQPALLRWTGAEGKGDYTDEEFFRLVVDKQWVDSSTGLFCSNDLAPRRIGKNWSQYKHPDISSSGEVWVSNTLYFEKVSRGPMFQKLEAERKAAEAARAAQTSKKEVAPEHGGPFWEDHMDDHWGWPHQYPGHNGHPTTGGAQSGVGSNIRKWSDSNAAKSPKLLKAMSEVVNTWDFEDEEDIKELINLTQEEWYDIIEENHGEWFAIAMLGQILEHYNRMFIRNKFLENKLKKAEARIIAMKKGEEPNANSEAA